MLEIERSMDMKKRETKDNDVVIRCKNIKKSYGRFQVLNGISTEVHAGEVVCIVGPSGGGKSTFLRTLNALEPINEGSIDILDVRLPASKKSVEHLRREVGMVFQSFNLFMHMSVRENLILAPMTASKISRSEANKRAEILLNRVDISDQIDKFPGQLSGGQQQRVAIARALAMEPRIMLFDEPTSALDPEMVNEVLDVMRDLAQSGMTMLVVTHEMNFAREVGDRVMFMVDGRLAVSSSPNEFFENPTDPRQSAFLSKIISSGASRP